MKSVLVLIVVLFSTCVASQILPNRAPAQYANPDFFLVVGQSDNLTQSALNLNNTVPAILQARSWTFTQLTAFYNESRKYYASQFGIFFDDISPFGSPNSPYFALSRGANAILTPLIATGKYRVFGTIDFSSYLPFTVDPRNPPLITLVEYVVTFNLSQVIPGWQFVPFNYGGAFAAANIVPSAVTPYDNLAFGIYNISAPTTRDCELDANNVGHDDFHHNCGCPHVNLDFYMRTPTPDRTEPVGLGLSTERGQFCSEQYGAGLSVMRVDAFSATPNFQGLYPTATSALWQFWRNPARSAIPSLFQYSPQVFPGNRKPTCLATI